MPPNNESFNEDELEAPEWLNTEFIAEVLRQHEKEPDIKMIDVKFSPASAKGDHYASIMFRASVEYTCSNRTISKSLIIKTMPEEEGHKKEFLGDSPIFETEIGMYTKVLPKFEQILREAGDDTVLCVPCLYHSLKPRKVMIFEDLVPQGYTVVRGRDLNFEELCSAYAKLAKWHAVSYKIMKEDPAYLKEFKNSFMELPNIINDPFIVNGVDKFIEMLDKVPELEQYKPHFEKIKEVCLNRTRDSMAEYRENHQKDAYYVLCHGDLHLRNMMFRNNKTFGALEDCMLLDFQMSYGGPMPLDLIYSMYQLMDTEYRENNLDELLYYYFTTFTKTLETIGYNGEMPVLVEFRRQFFRHKYFEFLVITTFLPLMTAMKKGSCDTSEVFSSDEARRNLYLNEFYIEDVKRILPRLLHQGYFE